MKHVPHHVLKWAPKHVLRRTAVICLAVPAITLLGASAAQADCQVPTAGSASADAAPDPWPTLSSDGTSASCSADDGHSHSHGNDMNDMPGMDMPGMNGGHSHGGSAVVERPRTAVLSAFGVVNVGVLGSAAVVRRRKRNARKGVRR